MICCERWKLWHFYSIVGRWSRNSQHPKLKTSKCFLEEKKCFSWKKKACFSSYYLIRSHLFYTKIMECLIKCSYSSWIAIFRFLSCQPAITESVWRFFFLFLGSPFGSSAFLLCYLTWKESWTFICHSCNQILIFQSS